METPFMKKMITLLVFSSLLFSLSGCGYYIVTHLLDDDDDSPPAAKVEECAGADENDVPDNALVQSNSIRVETVSQLYVYQDCDGKETSRGMVKNNDDKRLDLVAVKTAETVKSFSIRNLTTCREYRDIPFSSTGPERNLVHMKVGFSTKLSNNLKVQDGLNIISYTFRGDCKNGAPTCEDDDRKVIESGYLSLDVDHVVTDLKDAHIVKMGPNNTTCP
jgi:hypothetical protein